MNQQAAQKLTARGHIDEFDFIDILASGPHPASRSVPEGAILTLHGWAVIAEDPVRATGVFVRIDDGSPLAALAGLARHDVAQAFNNAEFAASGFRGAFTTAHLALGEHIITFAVRSDDGHLLEVADTLTFSIDASVEKHVLAGTTTPARLGGEASFALTGEFTEAHIDEVVVLYAGGRARPHLPPLPLTRGDELLVSGWAIDAKAGTAAGTVRLLLDELPTSILVQYGLARSDVAAAFDNPEFTTCGFNTVISMASMPAGMHELALLVEDRSGRFTYETSQHVDFTLAETY